jgi:hypothetical protein
VPASLSGLTSLRFLSLANNKLNGNIPAWRDWPSLQVRCRAQQPSPLGASA